MEWQQASSAPHGEASSSTSSWTASNQGQTSQIPVIPNSAITNAEDNAQIPSPASNFTPAQTILYHATHAMHAQATTLPPETQTNIHALISTLWNADIDDMSTREEFYLQEGQPQAAEPNHTLVLKTSFVEFLFNAMKAEGVGRNEILCLLGWMADVSAGTWEEIMDVDWTEEGGEGNDDDDDDEYREGDGNVEEERMVVE